MKKTLVRAASILAAVCTLIFLFAYAFAGNYDGYAAAFRRQIGTTFTLTRSISWKYYPTTLDIEWKVENRSIVDFAEKPNFGDSQIGTESCKFIAKSIGTTIVNCFVTSGDYIGYVDGEQTWITVTETYPILIEVSYESGTDPTVSVKPTPKPTPRPTSGTANGLKWNITDDGTFQITGKGEIPAHDSDGAVWNRSIIKKIVIGEGITGIGDYAFSGTKATSVSLPSSLTKIGKSAFYSLDATEVLLPSGLKTIGDEAFSDSKIESIRIPDGVYSIGQEAFYDCYNLESVILPANLTVIPDSMFSYCYALKSIVWPKALETISDYSLSNCTSLTELNLPSSVQSIGEYAFNRCEGIIEVNLPDSVTSIGTKAFNNCKFLTNVKMKNTKLTTLPDGLFENLPALKTVELPNNLKAISANLFCKSGISELNIPNSVTAIGEKAFSESALTELSIPDSVTSIGAKAFYKCKSLTKVQMGNGLKTLPDYLFEGATALKTVTLPNNLEALPTGLFKGSGLTEIMLPATVATVGDGAFDSCACLESVYMDNSRITSLPSGLFKNLAALTYVSLPRQLTTIPEELFRGSGISLLHVPRSVTTIEKYALADCKNLAEITLPEALSTVGEGVFSKSGLTWISIPDSLTALSYKMFYGCESLTSISLPDTLTTIESYALSGCILNEWRGVLPSSLTTVGESAFYNSGIRSLFFPDSITIIGANAFKSCNSLDNVLFESGPETLPSELFYNLTALSYVSLPDNLTSIPSGSFMNCSSLEWIFIPDNVTEIGESAFSSSSVSSVSIGDSVKTIGASAFRNCKNLTDVGYAPALKYIKDNAFAGCSNFTSILAPNLVEIGSKAFYDCTALTTFPYTSKLERIGSSAFEKSSLTGKLVLPASLKNMANDVFRNCDNITSVECEIGLKEIGKYAFYDCDALSQVYLPSTLSDINMYAFSGCNSLKNIHLPEGLVSIDRCAFENTGLTGGIIFPTTLKKYGWDVFRNTDITDVYFDVYYDKSLFEDIESLFTSDITIHYRTSGMLDNGFYWEQNGYLVTISGTGTFTKTNIPWNYNTATQIKFTTGVTSIADFAMPTNKLSVVYLPLTLKRIGKNNFPSTNAIYCEDSYWWFNQLSVGQYNGQLNWSSYRANLFEVDSSVFRPITHSYLGKYSLPDNIKEVRKGAFKGLEISEIYFHAHIQSIGSEAFADNQYLDKVYIPSMDVTIADDAFKGCKNVVFYCYKGSTADAFAQRKGFPVAYIG